MDNRGADQGVCGGTQGSLLKGKAVGTRRHAARGSRQVNGRTPERPVPGDRAMTPLEEWRSDRQSAGW